MSLSCNRLGIFVMVLMLWNTQSAGAQTITRVDPLSFGDFALRNNSSIHNLRVTRTNVVTNDGAFAMGNPPMRAQYDLSGFPADTPFTVDIPDTTLSLNGGGSGDYFTLEQFTPGTGLMTDSSGNASVRFGATLKTSGIGSMYSDGSYIGNIDITINY